MSLFLDSNSWISRHILVLLCLTYKLLRILALFSYHSDFAFSVFFAVFFFSLTKEPWYHLKIHPTCKVL